MLWKKEGRNTAETRLIPPWLIPIMEKAWFVVIKNQTFDREYNTALLRGAVDASSDFRDAICKKNIHMDETDNLFAKFFYLNQKQFIRRKVRLATSIPERELPGKHRAWKVGYKGYLNSILFQIDKRESLNDPIH